MLDSTWTILSETSRFAQTTLQNLESDDWDRDDDDDENADEASVFTILKIVFSVFGCEMDLYYSHIDRFFLLPNWHDPRTRNQDSKMRC